MIASWIRGWSLALGILGAVSNVYGNFTDDLCHTAVTCGGCMAVNPSCAWCADPVYEEHGVSRCMKKPAIHSTGTQGCRGRWIFPDPHVTTNNPALGASTTRISPVQARFELRPGITASITVSVKIQPEHIKKGKLRTKLRVKSDVMVSISSMCHRFTKRKSTFICYGPFKENQILLFNITIKTKKCLRKMGRVKFRVFPGKSTRLAMKLRSVCRCRCESGAHKVLGDPYCSNHGDKVCGHCECHVNYYGKQCECRGMPQPGDSCRIPNTTEICSGRGVCLCGKCQCNQEERAEYYGKYCECEDTSCDRYDSMICGGMNRGRCMCGKCVCQTGFIGAACHIATSVDGCVASTKKVCDGHGSCVKGHCQCDVPYHGTMCEECVMCEGRCLELRPCVQCMMFMNGPLELEECKKRCSSRMKVQVVDLLYDDNGEREACVYRDPLDGMYVFFQYMTTGENNTDIVLTVQRSKA